MRPTEKPVEHKGVGVGRHLRRDPGDQPCEAGGQGLSEAKDPLEACEGDLPLLPKPSLLCPLGNQQDAALGQAALQPFGFGRPDRLVACGREVRL